MSGKKKKAEGQSSFPAAKRLRPGGSCAECKRLKIKCTRGEDAAFPCDSCIRRGCQAICPEGSLTSGKAGRFVLANTEELHRKIDELSGRIRELEDALQELQAASSTEPHPLLRRDLLLVKAPLERGTVLPEGRAAAELEQLEPLDALGSLSLRTEGRSNFHAQTAGSWYYLQNENPAPSAPQDDDEDDAGFALSVDILYASHTFPLGTLEDARNDLRTRIQEFIPDRDVGLRLVENYFHGMAWMYDPIPRPVFDSTILPAVYTPYFPLVRTCDPTILAVYFIVLAIGSLLDLDLPNYSPQATRYYQLARAALALDVVLDEPALATVQALHLIGFFLHMSDSKGGFGTSWALMGLNAKLAVGIGLHRDSTKWNLPPREEDTRQKLFWELYTYDTWQSMPSGRPPSFQRLSVDCKMPYEALLASDAQIDDPCSVFKAWKHRFCHERIAPMVEQSFGPRTPAYATVLLLDRRIREDAVPPLLQLPRASASTPAAADHTGVILTMQRYAVLCVREISLLLMHRPFFAQAAAEKTPLETRFAPSILAVYRSSCAIVAAVRDLYDQQPRLAPRAWFFWAHAFSATICLGGLVARCPGLGLAPSALAHIESACELFGKVTDSNRTSKALPSMLKLRDKARQALADYRAAKGEEQGQGRGDDAELSALVGETRLVVHRERAQTQQLPSPEQSTCGSADSPALHVLDAATACGFVDVQPSLQTYPGYYIHPHPHPAFDDEASTTYRPPDPIPVHGYADFQVGQSSGSEQFLPQPYPGQEQFYYYPPDYVPVPQEQQVFADQGGRDHTWRNFMSQLGMDFS